MRHLTILSPLEITKSSQKPVGAAVDQFWIIHSELNYVAFPILVEWSLCKPPSDVYGALVGLK